MSFGGLCIAPHTACRHGVDIDTLRSRNLKRRLRQRFALFGQLEKVWVIIEILVGGPEFLACVHGEIYVVVLIGHIEAGDASLAGAKH